MINEFKALEKIAYELIPEIFDGLSISFSNVEGSFYYNIFIFLKNAEVKHFRNINDAINYIERQEILKRTF